MGFYDNFPDAEIMAALGDDINYTRNASTTALKAIVDRNVERIGNDGYVVALGVTVEFLKVALGYLPARGDSINDGTKDFIVDAIIKDDGVYVAVAVH